VAFPTVPTVGASQILFTLNTAGGASKTFPSLTTLGQVAGDLLIAIAVLYDGNSTNAEFSSWGASFTETATYTDPPAHTPAHDSVMILMAIPGAHASTPPEAGTMAVGVSPDVGALAPSWGAEDNLWIAVGGSGEDSLTGSFTGVGTPPTNYTGEAQSGITADAVGGVEASVAFRQLNTASENPGAWTMDASNARGAAQLIAVRPAAVVYEPRHGFVNFQDPGVFAKAWDRAKSGILVPRLWTPEGATI
jgi:hypothetical protein